MTKDGRWARAHEKCVMCGTTEIPHHSYGSCDACWGRSPQHKEIVRRYQASERGKEVAAKVQASESYREWRKEYGRQRYHAGTNRENRSRYLGSEKGKLTARANAQRGRDREAGVISSYSRAMLEITLEVFDRRCAACGATARVCVDHHRSLRDGHPLDIANAVLLCRRCNSRKKDRRPEEFYPPEVLAIIECKLRLASYLAGL